MSDAKITPWTGYDENGVWLSAFKDEHGNIVPSHATRNRAAALLEEASAARKAGNPSYAAGIEYALYELGHTDLVKDVQDAVFLWSCESLTAEEAMRMIVSALHA